MGVVDPALMRAETFHFYETSHKIIDLVKEKELKVEDYEERVNICEEVRQVLIVAGYTNCLVYPYGSSINSVGFKDSDLDLFLELDLPGNISNISKILEKSSEFVCIESVPHARVPIVKAIHSLSGIKCDLSFEHKANLWNTEFIRFCCLSDPRVRSLIMVVRYWARMHNLVGRDGQVRMCNYALTLLVIAYLQQLPQPVLHSVHELLPMPDITTTTTPSTFCSLLLARKAELSPQLSNKETIAHLLTGFFNHYLRYHYEHYGVSVLLGRACKRKSVAKKSKTSIFQSDNPVCVQDPFETDYNVCRNITEIGVAVWRHALQEALEKMMKLQAQADPSSSLDLLFKPSTPCTPAQGWYGCWDTGTQLQYPSIQDYHAATIRQNIIQSMPPWWRRWRRLS